MAKEDIAVKQYLRGRQRFADAYNANMFGGRQVIKPEELSEINAESDIIEKCWSVIFTSGAESNMESEITAPHAATAKTVRRALWRYRDIVMRWRGMTLMILACEVQGRVHHAMPVRGLLYDALSYTDQMSEIWEQLGDEEKRAVDGAEFFSRFRKEDAICPVATLVFYYGEEPWDGSLELYDMFKLEKEADMEAVKEFVANYKVNLVDVSRIEDLSVYHSDLKEVLGMVKCREDKNALLAYANENREFFESVDYETVNALGAMIHGGGKYAEMFKNKKAEEECNMCKALEDLWADGVKEGEERGEERGEARGISKGIRKAVFMLRKVGASDDVIVDMIKTEYNLTNEEVQRYMHEQDKV